MRIRSAEFLQFRNISAASIHFSSRLTALIGPNGQGKTNAIEGLYMVAALRPLRSVTRAHLIREGCPEARVSVHVEHERTAMTYDLGLGLSRGARQITKDDKTVEVTSFLSALAAVSFTPDDLAISVVNQVLAVALPEELYFRGYLQSRMEALWPARRRLFGAMFGKALVISCGVFALAHFVGEYNLARLGPFFPALLFGLLRGRTGRITAAVTYHAFCNVLSQVLAASYG